MKLRSTVSHPLFRRVAFWLAIVVAALSYSSATLAWDESAPMAVAANSAEASSAPSGAAEPASGPMRTTESRTLLSLIRDGGIVMFPLLGCSFVLTVFLFERAIMLRRGRVIPGPFVKRFLHQLKEGQLDREQAIALCQGNGSTVARVFGAGVRKWGRTSNEIETAMNDAGERATNDLKRYLRVFNGVATVTPLLGLLGTVFGMMKSFKEIGASEGMARTEMLAVGISEALVATATGLSIAVPALILYWFFVSRVDRLIVDIDKLGLDLVDIIASDGVHETAAQTKSVRRRAPPAAA